MKSLKYLFLAFSGLVIFNACQDEIDLELPPNDPELIVEAYLTDLDFYLPEGDLDCSGIVTIPREEIEFAALLASFFPIDSVEREADYFPFNKVILSTTSDYFADEAPPAVSNATVRLFKDGELVEELAEDAAIPGTYRFTHDPVVGSTYNLEIEALGNTYTTEDEIYNEVPPLIEVNAVYQENFLGDSLAYYMGLNTFEQPGVGDHYRWIFYINNKLVSAPNFISTTDDEALDGLCLFDFDVYGNELELGDTLVVFQLKTSENYFNFINTVRSQTAFVGGPFDAPPAPIIGNIRNETNDSYAQGFFHAGALSANFVIVPDTIPTEAP